MRTMTKEMRQYIDDCMACHTMCMETMAQCLDMGGKMAEGRLMRMLMDCAMMCTMCADCMCCDSMFTKQMCDMCAQMCETCAKECEKMGGDMMKRCADTCRRCAKSCSTMAKAA